MPTLYRRLTGGRFEVCGRGQSGVRAERDLRVWQLGADGEGLPGDTQTPATALAITTSDEYKVLVAMRRGRASAGLLHRPLSDQAMP